MIRKRGYFSLIITGIFFIAIFAPLCGAILGEDQSLSYTERRSLKQQPAFPEKVSDIRGYIDAFEEYYNDQFGLRLFFIQSYAAVKKVLGDGQISSPSRNVGTKDILRGKDGWHFLNRIWDGDPVSDYRNLDLYSDGELLRATLFFAARVDWLKERGIEYLHFFAPNKHTIYSEYLPDYIVKEGEISAWDQLNDSLRRYTDVQFVDLRKTLIEKKSEAAKYWKENSEEAALYFKMDSHWNGAGADMAQYVIAEKIAGMFPGKIEPTRRPPQDFYMARFAGDITLIMGRQDKDAYGPMLKSGTCTPETEEDYLQRSHETHCPQGQLTALVFNDSFLPPLKPYFSDYFSRTVYRWQRMTLAEVEKQIAIKKPDIVIEQRAERHLPFTPDIKQESYDWFWAKNWEKWKKVVFTMDMKAAAQGKYATDNTRLTYDGKRQGLVVEALTTDPMFHFPELEMHRDRLYMVRIRMHSDDKTALQIYFSLAGQEERYPSEENSLTVPVARGESDIFIPFFNLGMAGKMRFDPVNKQGTYFIKSFEIKEITAVRL